MITISSLLVIQMFHVVLNVFCSHFIWIVVIENLDYDYGSNFCFSLQVNDQKNKF